MRRLGRTATEIAAQLFAGWEVVSRTAEAKHAAVIKSCAEKRGRGAWLPPDRRPASRRQSERTRLRGALRRRSMCNCGWGSMRLGWVDDLADYEEPSGLWRRRSCWCSVLCCHWLYELAGD